jgi:SOS-response transcriptional repressor LexA
VLGRIESALQITPGPLVRLADWQRTPAHVRAEVERLTAQSRTLANWLTRATGEHASGGRNLDALYRSGELQRTLDAQQANVARLASVCYQVPLINKVAAGYPAEFTDLEYPARVADEYISVPDVSDPAAFAARVVDASMLPEYRQGDIIIFSPARAAADGDDCFIRLMPDHHTTFKRVFFDDEQTVRLQPLNPAFASQQVTLDEVSGIYPAVYRVQPIRSAP